MRACTFLLARLCTYLSASCRTGIPLPEQILVLYRKNTILLNTVLKTYSNQYCHWVHHRDKQSVSFREGLRVSLINLFFRTHRDFVCSESLFTIIKTQEKIKPKTMNKINYHINIIHRYKSDYILHNAQVHLYRSKIRMN